MLEEEKNNLQQNTAADYGEQPNLYANFYPKYSAVQPIGYAQVPISEEEKEKRELK